MLRPKPIENKHGKINRKIFFVLYNINPNKTQIGTQMGPIGLLLDTIGTKIDQFGTQVKTRT